MLDSRLSLHNYLNVQSASAPSFSPDGQSIAFLMNTTGVPQVWCVSAGGGWPHQATFFSERAAELAFSRHEQEILFTMDQGGNEHHQLYLVKPDGSGLRALTDCPSAIHNLGCWSHDGQRVAWTANREHPAYFSVYVQSVTTGEIELVLATEGTYQVLAWSMDDRQLLVACANSNCDNDLFLLNLLDGTVDHLTPHQGEALYGQVAWRGDGGGFYLLSNQDSQFAQVCFYDLASRNQQVLYSSDHDVELLRLAPDGATLAGSINEAGYSRLFLLPTDGGPVQPVEDLPLAVYTKLEWSPDARQLVIAVDGSRCNPNLWLYDRDQRRSWQLTFAPTAGIPASSLIEPELVHFDSFDGMTIPAFYYRPSTQGQSYPVVIDIHGGPESQRRVNFNPVTQYLLQAGYAVFAPNVRGSSGYGKRYLHLDDVELRMDAVKDIRYAVDWLVSLGGADAQRLAVMGGSYGGFMVLACITEYPNLWAGAVDIVGIADFVTFLERTGVWRRHLRESEYGSLACDRDFLTSISPLHKADRIRAPLLVIHGANDPRVPIEEAEQIVAAVKERGGQVEYLRYEDEGHGIVKLNNRLDAYGKAVTFLDRFVRRG